MEGKLGRTIHRIGNMWAHVKEGRSLDREEKRATKEYQQMRRVFGGANGEEVTMEQIAEYLRLDFKSMGAIARRLHFNDSRWPLQLEYLQRLETTQDLHTPEGRATAIQCFTKSKEMEICLTSILGEPNSTKDKFTIEQGRLIRAYEVAISILI